MKRAFNLACITILFSAAFAATATAAAPESAAKPNVIWFVVDDMSANFSGYGEKFIETPNVDRLAAEGVRFSKAFVTAPVCSACRSALITGMYQTSIGAHHHRSGRGAKKIHLPDGVKLVPELFQQAGYFTCIGDGLPKESATGRPAGLGKTDYNFEWDQRMYDDADWAGRQPGQPFFMQVQLPGGKLRGNSAESARRLAQQARRQLGDSVNASDVTLPPYYPRDAVLLQDWAAYLDAVRFTDRHVGQVLDRLRAEGELDRTVVVFMTDHGISHARGKQFLYDEGTHIPLILSGPGVPRGVVRDDLVEQIDVAALSLAAAGIAIPESMHARDVLAKDYFKRDAVFAARDRCDETVDRIRSVRSDRYLYIRNFHPQRPHLQPNAYKDGKSIAQALRALHNAGRLDPLAETLLFSPTRPEEELYEWTTDRWQTKNLAAEPAQQQPLVELRGRLDRWMAETNDQGLESQAMYDSDMAVYATYGQPEIEKNIALTKRWTAEGK